MKSRITEKSQKILLSYGIFENNFDSLVNISKKYSIEVKPIMPSQLDTKVSNLLKAPTLAFETYPENTTSCILLCGLDNRTTNALLKDLKTSTLDIPLKALLTQSNKSWEFKTLLEHLSLEHQKLHG
jgi:hypothetical protein